jgi:hypothetical protein
MGADIYRQSITKPAHDKWYPIFKAAVKARNIASNEVKMKERLVGVSDAQDTKADLETAKAMVEALQKEAEEAYDNMYPEGGYFRDSYNPGNFFGAIELSWWGDVLPKLNKKRLLSVAKMKWLKKEVESREFTKLPVFTDETPEDTLKYFAEQRQKFIDFLQSAIDAKEAIYCSL